MVFKKRPIIDKTVRPLCVQPNERPKAADPNAAECWCEELEFPRELLDQVPEMLFIKHAFVVAV